MDLSAVENTVFWGQKIWTNDAMQSTFEQYRKHWAIRFREYELLRRQRFDELTTLANTLADFMYKEFKVDKVYLFGSLLNIDRFRLDSDIDLAVQGLPEKLLYNVHGLLSSKALPHKVDLLLIEECPTYIKDMIVKGGRLLAEQK